MNRDERITASRFRARMQRAERGVALVAMSSGAGGTFTTGWLITDDLVVSSGFAETPPAQTATRVRRGTEERPAQLIHLTPADHATPVALFRLSQPLAGSALRLSRDELRSRYRQVFMLQHAGLGSVGLEMSFGQASAGQPFTHSAPSSVLSTGAPIFDEEWDVIGLHLAELQGDNLGMHLPALLDLLSLAPEWGEIAAQHGLAVRRTITLEVDEADDMDPRLIAAAVQWTFDAAALPEADADALRPHVADMNARRWSLPGDVRHAVLGDAGSLAVLQRARRSVAPVPSPGQRALDAILEGPPYDLAAVDEDELPYWLQATRWFADVVPELPKPADVDRRLKHLRVRGRPARMLRDGFRGRSRELQTLHRWYADDVGGPTAVTGIGGVGKTALVARFALDLPHDTVLLWLDFDRADLAPDDLLSVLRALREQVAIQVDGIDGRTSAQEDWRIALDELQDALVPHRFTRAPLLILDGFEVAQHAHGHRQIWQLLEALVPVLPGLRVLVSGRASIGEVRLDDRPVRELPLKGLPSEEAEAWLRRAGIGDSEVIAQVIAVTRGVPLGLQLAVRLLQAEGDLADVPAAVREELVQGFLYQRVLDRVIDPDLREIARDALVLRRVTPEIGEIVLGRERDDAHTLFERLQREVALVGDVLEGDPGAEQVLRLRPELRAAALDLLESADPDHVRELDETAAAYYADAEDPADVAELVYHRLRLKDFAGAHARWRDELMLYLGDADDTLSDDARDWLANQGSTVPRSHVATQRFWELEAETRVRNALSRGQLQAAADVLVERRERTPESELIVYDAWLRWQSGDRAGARRILDQAPRVEVDERVARDRRLLTARLSAAAGQRDAAEQRLATLADRDSGLDPLLLLTARIHVLFDAGGEVTLLEQIPHNRYWRETPRLLSRFDVVHPVLADMFSTGPTPALMSMELTPYAVSETIMLLERARSSDLDVPARLNLDEPPAMVAPGPIGTATRLELKLARRAWRRWRLALDSFLFQAAERAERRVHWPADAAVYATLAPFAALGQRGLDLRVGGRSLSDIVGPSERAGLFAEVVSPTRAQVQLARRVVGAYDRFWPERAVGGIDPRECRPELAYALVSVLSPDPLDLLLQDALGLPAHTEP